MVMQYELFSHNHALEILEHKAFAPLLAELFGAVQATPVFYDSRKSTHAVLQGATNTFFDRTLTDKGWELHPDAVEIPAGTPDSERVALKADFKKSNPTEDGSVQVEVQFGNAARWYSDILKMEASYAASRADVGVCIIPMLHWSKDIDSNVANFERARRELRVLRLVVRVPVLLIGISPGPKTPLVDVRDSGLSKLDLHERLRVIDQWQAAGALGSSGTYVGGASCPYLPKCSYPALTAKH